MAKLKNENPPQGEGNTGPSGTETVWDEAGLAEKTQEELIEIAGGFEILQNEATKEELIAAILEAQKEKASAGTDGDQGKIEGELVKDPPKDPKAGKEDPLPTVNEGEISVFSEARKGKTIVGVTGEPITFDSEGKAKVSKADADYLQSCPGFVIG